ncbi:thioredoxin-like protein [Aspergillus novofumigatus IBT 16806]|uniref:Thioredoxin-like protein n=1 Tax=Aspergillus novofumigatus (strain IBT 16806) TaxID=1392255 RepID=A0A2I1CGP8_ASPN1|nr:thioredoxin-like protein [Aspergillus novofumigatus IBT 16806]PKX96770.1 thioredoxin-like protein [Aspergillus novofumigatus IBT 16806]
MNNNEQNPLPDDPGSRPGSGIQEANLIRLIDLENRPASAMNKDSEQKHHPARDLDDDNDDDSLFEALENEDDSAYRAHRIEQLNAEFSASKNNRSSFRDPATTLVEEGLYPTLKDDQAVLDFTTQTHRCVIHFAHPDFARCGVMDEHIRTLATRHHEVRFARVDVRNTPFVVDKLSIRVLPCVIGFKDGIGVEQKRLLWKGILAQTKFKNSEDDSDISEGGSGDEGSSRRRPGTGRRTIRNGNGRHHGGDDDDDDDWD